MDTETRSLLRASLEAALADDSARTLPAVLHELGWEDVLAEDEAAATALLFEVKGEFLAGSHVLDSVFLQAVASAPSEVTRVVYPWNFSGGGGYGEALIAADRRTGVTPASGVLLGPVEEGERLLVPGTADGHPALLTARAPAGSPPGLLSALDPSVGLCAATGPYEDVRVVHTGAAGQEALNRGVAAARRALASELVGVSRAALRIAVEHVSSRTQFGRPIGSFQSVRHRLAEAHAFVAGTEAAVEAAWAEPGPAAAATAKAYAGAAHELVVRHSLQVCGAMGLTWEHPLHRYVRRGFTLNGLLGGTDELAAQAGLAEIGGSDRHGLFVLR